MNSNNVALVLDRITDRVSPQFHVAFDRLFHTVRPEECNNLDIQWQQKAGFLKDPSMSSWKESSKSKNKRKRSAVEQTAPDTKRSAVEPTVPATERSERPISETTRYEADPHDAQMEASQPWRAKGPTRSRRRKRHKKAKGRSPIVDAGEEASDNSPEDSNGDPEQLQHYERHERTSDNGDHDITLVEDPDIPGDVSEALEIERNLSLLEADEDEDLSFQALPRPEGEIPLVYDESILDATSKENEEVPEPGNIITTPMPTAQDQLMEGSTCMKQEQNQESFQPLLRLINYELHVRSDNNQLTSPPILEEATDDHSASPPSSTTLLDNIDHDFSTISNERFRDCEQRKWNQHYIDLAVYHATHGHSNVPHHYPANISLGHWSKRQRRAYKLSMKGEISTMTTDRVEALNMLGFVWDSQSQAWEANFTALLQFRRVYGHCRVPTNYKPNHSLANWVKVQRRHYKLFKTGKSSRLTENRFKRLDSIGFSWTIMSREKKPEENALTKVAKKLPPCGADSISATEYANYARTFD